jgi:hypothetical protein
MKSSRGRTYNLVFTSPLLYHLHHHLLLLYLIQFTFISDSMFQFNLTLLPSNSVRRSAYPYKYSTFVMYSLYMGPDSIPGLGDLSFYLKQEIS